MAIITADDIYEYLDQKPDDPVEELVIEKIANRASSIVEQALYPVEFTAWAGSATQKVIESDGTSVLRLPPYKADSITAVRYGAADSTALTASSYRIDGQSIYLAGAYGYLPYRYPLWSPGLYYVTAIWGYGPAPDAVVQVALEVAINIERSKEKGLYTEVIGVDGGGGLRFVGGLTRQQRGILADFKRRYAGVGVA
jgi:hypothetical protein